MDTKILITLCGILVIIGIVLYAIGDVLMLAGKTKIEEYPKLQAHVKLLSGTERMVALPEWRLIWGGLLGVFATPLALAGFVQIFVGLAPAGLGAALPPVILLSCASIVGAFVHGSFIYLGEYVQALNKVSDDSQHVIIDMFKRHRKIMIVTYAFLLGSLLIASVWFSVVVAMGGTAFPQWMAAVNPVTAFMLWLGIKKVSPKVVAENTEGAGFNIAYLIFFAFSTITLLNG